MGQKWIIDVLADLREFADLNGLPHLAAQLEITSGVAHSEISALLEGVAPTSTVSENKPASGFGPIGLGS